MDKSAWSGERLETFVFNENTIEHLHRYSVAIDHSKDKVVVDIASGEGYGSRLLAEVAKSVIGIDISETAIAEARKKYGRDNLTFKVGNAANIPLDDNSVDVVVSFETIEHHDKHQEMLKEMKRILRKDGLLILSSPDKKYYTDIRNYRNPFHIKELYFDEFKNMMKDYFLYTQFFFQNIFNGSIIIPENASTGFNCYEGDYNKIDKGKGFYPLYNICIASDIPISDVSFSMFNGTEIELLNKNKEMENLRSDISREIKKSWSYRIGNFFIKPISFFNWRK